MWQSMAQHAYDQCLISYKVNINDTCSVCGCWLIGVGVKCAMWCRYHPLSQSRVFYQDCSCYYSQSPAMGKGCAQAWSVIQAGGRGRRRPARRACLLLGPGSWHFQRLTPSNTPSFSILCVLSLSIWEGRGVFMLHSVPRLSMLYLVLTFSLFP